MDAMRCLACLVVFVIPTALSAGQSSLPIAGQWIPRDPVKAEALFAVGLTDVTAAGVTIEENGDSLRIVRKDADGALERMPKVNDRFEIEFRVRAG